MSKYTKPGSIAAGAVIALAAAGLYVGDHFRTDLVGVLQRQGWLWGIIASVAVYLAALAVSVYGRRPPSSPREPQRKSAYDAPNYLGMSTVEQRRIDTALREEHDAAVTELHQAHAVAEASYAAWNRWCKRALIAAAPICFAALIFSSLHLIGQNYDNARSKYAANVTRTEDEAPTFKERPAWRLADNLLKRNSESLRGNRADARYVTDGDDSRYTILVNGESYGRKEAGVAEWNGQGNKTGNFTVCRFDPKTVRALDGNLWNNLPRQINNTPGGAGLHFDVSDAYGTCEDGKAKLYWPATEYAGFPNTTQVFGALVIVDHAGNITFDRNVKVGERPGPVYPISLVKAQEAAIKATGSFGDWWYNRSKVAFDEDSVAGFGKDTDDNPNTGNTGQFALVTTEDRGVYVTPLIPNKTSKMISRMAVTEHDHAKAGTVNKLTLYTLPEARKSNTEVSQLIKATYSNLPYSSGIQIMEVTPQGARWTGTIGQDLVATYRFDITADGTSCLYDYDSGRELRCSGTDGGSAEPGAEGPDTSLPADVKDLTQLTAEQLAELRDHVDAEYDRRLAEAGGDQGTDASADDGGDTAGE